MNITELLSEAINHNITISGNDPFWFIHRAKTFAKQDVLTFKQGIKKVIYKEGTYYMGSILQEDLIVTFPAFQFGDKFFVVNQSEDFEDLYISLIEETEFLPVE